MFDNHSSILRILIHMNAFKIVVIEFAHSTLNNLNKVVLSTVQYSLQIERLHRWIGLVDDKALRSKW